MWWGWRVYPAKVKIPLLKLHTLSYLLFFTSYFEFPPSPLHSFSFYLVSWYCFLRTVSFAQNSGVNFFFFFKILFKFKVVHLWRSFRLEVELSESSDFKRSNFYVWGVFCSLPRFYFLVGGVWLRVSPHPCSSWKSQKKSFPMGEIHRATWCG